MIGKLWRGEIRLAVTFWIFFVLIPVPFRLFYNVLDRAMERSGMFDGTSLDPNTGLALIVFFSLIVILLLYQLFTSIAVWRSAKRYEAQRTEGIWPYGAFAKFVVICSWLLAILG